MNISPYELVSTRSLLFSNFLFRMVACLHLNFRRELIGLTSNCSSLPVVLKIRAASLFSLLVNSFLLAEHFATIHSNIPEFKKNWF